MKIDNVELNVVMKALYKILKLYNDCMILSVKKHIRFKKELSTENYNDFYQYRCYKIAYNKDVTMLR